GCDSLVISTTTLLPSDTIEVAATTCDPEMVGVSKELLVNQYGCDSLVITTTTLLPSDTIEVAATTCDPEMVGVSQKLLVNQYGCDSLVITTTTLLPSDTTRIAQTTCDLKLVGADTLRLINQFGCDSLIITTTNLIPSDPPVVSVSAEEVSTCLTESLTLQANLAGATTYKTWQIKRTGYWVDLTAEHQTTLILENFTSTGETEYRFLAINHCDTVSSEAVKVTVEDCSEPEAIEFFLINANDNTTIEGINDQDIFILEDLPSHFNMSAVTTEENVDRVRFDLSGPINSGKTEKVKPYAVFGDSKGNYRRVATKAGSYTLKATIYHRVSGKLVAGEWREITFDILSCSSTTLTARAGSDKELDCTSGMVKLDGSTSGGLAPFTASWTGPNGFTSAELTPAVSLVGTYTLSITDEMGCIKEDKVEVAECKVMDCTTTDLTVNAGSNKELDCTNGSVRLDGSISGGVTPHTVSWTGPDGFMSSELTPTVSLEGTYTLTITDGMGCTKEDKVEVTECEVIDCSTTDLTAKAGSDKELDCTSGSVKLDGSTSGGVAPRTASWTGPDGFTSSELTPTVSMEGTYTLTVTDGMGCTREDKVEVIICQEEEEDECITGVTRFVLVNADTDNDIGEITENAVFDLSQTGRNLNVRVEIANCENDEIKSVRIELRGDQSRNRTENKAPYTMAGDNKGNYYVHKFIPGEFQLTGKSYFERGAKGSQGASMTVTFSFVNGNPAQAFEFAEPNKAPAPLVSFYPVPANDNLKVGMQFFDEGTYFVDMFDIAGKQVKTYRVLYDEVSGKIFSLDVSDLSSGIYHIRLRNNNYLSWKKISINR
ncbi:MAG: T9SS type A sorting domain-containing protein, partial [Bacteroidota bacterium]